MGRESPPSAKNSSNPVGDPRLTSKLFYHQALPASCQKRREACGPVPLFGLHLSAFRTRPVRLRFHPIPAAQAIRPVGRRTKASRPVFEGLRNWPTTSFRIFCSRNRAVPWVKPPTAFQTAFMFWHESPAGCRSAQVRVHSKSWQVAFSRLYVKQLLPRFFAPSQCVVSRLEFSLPGHRPAVAVGLRGPPATGGEKRQKKASSFERFCVIYL